MRRKLELVPPPSELAGSALLELLGCSTEPLELESLELESLVVGVPAVELLDCSDEVLDPADRLLELLPTELEDTELSELLGLPMVEPELLELELGLTFALVLLEMELPDSTSVARKSTRVGVFRSGRV